MAGWRLSAFGDEISNDLDEQLQALRQLQIGYLELRGVWGKNVLQLDDQEVGRVAERCAALGIAVSAIGSPVGKTPITNPLSVELDNLARIFEIAEGVGTRMVRVFSFYPPEASQAAWSDAALLEEAIVRLSAMNDAARNAGMRLVLENESGIVGDTVARCRHLLSAPSLTTLGFAWDPANFVAVGEPAAVSAGWDALGPRTQHVHIKDYRMVSREICVAGEGDGQIDELLTRLGTINYSGFLALEPHLAFAGHSSGFSGVDGMERAVTALRGLLASLGMAEQLPSGTTSGTTSWTRGEVR